MSRLHRIWTESRRKKANSARAAAASSAANFSLLMILESSTCWFSYFVREQESGRATERGVSYRSKTDSRSKYLLPIVLSSRKPHCGFGILR